jgi:phosphate transport system substrate-binding protein
MRKGAWSCLAAGVILLAACGKTSNVGGPAAATPGSSSAGSETCATTGAKPGYKNDIATVAGASSSLSGAGSTFINPMMSIWADAYNKAARVQVAYQSIGSGGGVAQITAATVDFGASDAPLKDSEIQAAKGPIVHVPLVLGAVVPTYNLSGIKSGLKFDGETLGKIFAGKIASWNDPAIAALNPGVQLPNTTIAVVHRSDGSGTTDIWTDYLTKASPTWVATLGQGKSRGKEVAWPTGIGGKGNEGVSGAVGQTPGALGYVELQYALAQNLPYGAVKNKSGSYVQPCVATVTAATQGVTFPDDLRFSLTDQSDKDAYPIAGTTWALIYVNQAEAAKAATLVNFFSWVLSDGQDLCSSINYAPLGPDLRAKALGQLRRITINGQPVAK